MLTNSSMIDVQGPVLGQAALCEPILRLLPEWFGIEVALKEYVDEIDKLPTFLAVAKNQVVGFLTVKQHSEYAAEIYVMAVHPSSHRSGVGRQLVKIVEQTLDSSGVEYLQVKTLGLSHPDKHYAQTRAFYQSVGFRPLEEFTNLWPENPCLQMVKRLSTS
ncbi:GNAT family N-acetyltransferase [Romeria aff. gracilis LEGE 07310]|uniref:GNAT family N-acetyltransferase n=1 Tax=Vasconcelosia minhoensis LEGE 07310 TaxID=915328 RepID=A0A8J7AFD7_9CYAN|nr:GNAT family N-acetyltransferase [Romeria gracilis]MBE9078029.1 GNAT family N-acetyltransferase [Romeria aff. gracilis LEGE 07310]